MKRIFLLLFILTFALANNAKPKGRQFLWPDGSPMDAFFQDTKKVDVEALGKQYVITDYGVKKDSTLVQTKAIQAVIRMRQ